MVWMDTSLFVSLYVNDAHSLKARALMAGHPSVWLTPLHDTEFTHALYQHVFRNQITLAEANGLHALFAEHRDRHIWVRAELPERSWFLAASLAKKHASTLGLRTLDTLHIAAALELGADQFWTFDERQNKAARAEGFKVLR